MLIIINYSFFNCLLFIPFYYLMLLFTCPMNHKGISMKFYCLDGRWPLTHQISSSIRHKSFSWNVSNMFALSNKFSIFLIFTQSALCKIFSMVTLLSLCVLNMTHDYGTLGNWWPLIQWLVTFLTHNEVIRYTKTLFK